MSLNNLTRRQSCELSFYLGKRLSTEGPFSSWEEALEECLSVLRFKTTRSNIHHIVIDFMDTAPNLMVESCNAGPHRREIIQRNKDLEKDLNTYRELYGELEWEDDSE